MVKLSNQLRLINFIVYLSGVAPYDSETGRRSCSLFIITILRAALFSTASAFYLPHAFSSKYFRHRPFSSTFILISWLIEALVIFLQTFRKSVPVTSKSLRKSEKLLGISVDYEAKYTIFYVYFVVIASVGVNISMQIFHFWKVMPKIAAFNIMCISFLPLITRYVAMARYGLIFNILEQQLKALRNTALTDLQTMVAHDYILELCNAFQRSEGFILAFSAFASSVRILLNQMTLNEAVEGCLGENGFCSPIQCICQGVELVSFVIELRCVTFIPYRTKSKAEEFVRHKITKYVVEKRPTHLDVRLLVYYLGKPSVNLSAAGYFDLSPAVLMSVLSENFVYYLLMVQMKVIVSLSKNDN